MFTDNKDFYPTSKNLFKKMFSMVDFKRSVQYILEPSAGSGNIIEFLKKQFGGYSDKKIHAIENDPNLISILNGKDVNVVDKDFLHFTGEFKYDLIIANPPFSNGDKHLLKAIDIMYSGQIVFILNAETINNPYTNTRKLLAQKLDELGAKIQFHENQFKDAERKTGVEIALIYINIKKEIKEDYYDNLEKDEKQEVEFDEKFSVAEKPSIKNLVELYNLTIESGTKTILDFYSDELSRRYLTLEVDNVENPFRNNTSALTELVKYKVNMFVDKVKKSFWNKVLTINDVQKRMTRKKCDEFSIFLQKNSDLAFTENNIRDLILGLIGDYESILSDAVVEIFDEFTKKYAYDDDNIHQKNTHYFDGWKTNSAFIVNKKVIIRACGWDTPVINEYGWWSDTSILAKLNDIDIVMNYFDGGSDYVSIADAITEGKKNDQTKKLKSTYFTITHYKKGTIHLTFNEEDIRRRFNLTATKGKDWLPCNYGEVDYDNLSDVEKKVVDGFEGKKTYNSNLNPNGNSLFKIKQDLPLLEVGEEK